MAEQRCKGEDTIYLRAPPDVTCSLFACKIHWFAKTLAWLIIGIVFFALLVTLLVVSSHVSAKVGYPILLSLCFLVAVGFWLSTACCHRKYCCCLCRLFKRHSSCWTCQQAGTDREHVLIDAEAAGSRLWDDCCGSYSHVASTDDDDGEATPDQAEKSNVKGFYEFLYLLLYRPLPSRKTELKVITVRYNARQYASCQYLWAGIISALGERLEKYFGVTKIRMARRYKKISLTTPPGKSYAWHLCGLYFKRHILFCIVLYVIGLAIAAALIYFYDIRPTLKQKSLFAIIGSFLVGLVAAISTLSKLLPLFLKSTKSYVDSLNQRLMKNDFNEGLGFMRKVMAEVDNLKQTVSLMGELYNTEFRVLILIDDVDRCPDNRIVSLLQAVNLLFNTGPSPFICVVAVDPRVVMRAFEDAASKSSVDAVVAEAAGSGAHPHSTEAQGTNIASNSYG